MLDTLKKGVMLVGPGQGGRWLVVIALALAVSIFEAAGTLLVFGLLSLLVGEQEGFELPLVGDITGWLPGFAPDDLLVALAIAVAVFFALRGVLAVIQSYVQYRVAENAGARLSSRMLEGYLSMPYVFHLQRNSSELIRNAFESTQNIVKEGLIPSVRLLSKLAIVLGIVVVLLAASPLATMLAAGVLVPLLWVILRVVQPRVKRLGRIAQAMAKENLQALQQSLHGVRDIMLLGRADAFVQAYYDDRRRLARTRYLRQTFGEVPRVGVETGVVGLIAVLLALGALTEGGIQRIVPLLGMFGYAAVRIMPELTSITAALNSLKFVSAAVDNIHDDLVAFDAHHRPRSSEPLALRQEIRLEHVSFTYPNAHAPALSAVDLTIHAGESIGIIGPTGGGKTTLIDLLLGLLEPTEGIVRVDGVDIRTRLAGWHANLGVVPQMIFLTDDTIRRNVALGLSEEEIDDVQVLQALQLAQLNGFVESLPDGLDTFVGERGVRVSGGQRQRLAIARALYRDPDVLVFDEGTSALDNETEAALMDALEELRSHRTLITVAHRLTTVEACDRVVLIRDGRMVDVDTYESLAGRHAGLQAGHPLG